MLLDTGGDGIGDGGSGSGSSGAPPDSETARKVEALFEDARIARAKWLAGEVNPRNRELEHTTTEYPTFSQSMGQMFLGGWAGRARRLMLGENDDRDRNRRQQPPRS